MNTRQCYKRILRTGPIAYWPLWEGSGSVAYDRTANGRNGAHTGVDLRQVGIGDGRTCPYYDGANDYTNIYSASLAAAFNGAEGTLGIFAKAANAAMWTTGTLRRAFYLADAGDNDRIVLQKEAAANTLTWYYQANGTAKSVQLSPFSSVGWMCMALTWSAMANRMQAYLNGVQQGATQTALGVWADAPNVACIGATSTVPANVWHGYLAHCALWDRALSQPEIYAIALAGGVAAA